MTSRMASAGDAASDIQLIAAVRRTQMLARMRRVVEEEGFDG